VLGCSITLKIETLNPVRSFKGRGSETALSQLAQREEAPTAVCASADAARVVVYITGMNRIRHFFHEAAPASRPYFVLPIYDDEPTLYRSIGTGMRRKRPRFDFCIGQFRRKALSESLPPWWPPAVEGSQSHQPAASPPGLAAALAFLVTMVALFVYWHRSLADMRAAIRPIHPPPTNRLNVPV
jgi:hypothetical protein